MVFNYQNAKSLWAPGPDFWLAALFGRSSCVNHLDDQHVGHLAHLNVGHRVGHHVGHHVSHLVGHLVGPQVNHLLCHLTLHLVGHRVKNHIGYHHLYHISLMG